ncbi:hypothetical protein QTN25_002877 [Entamoeba marina]
MSRSQNTFWCDEMKIVPLFLSKLEKSEFENKKEINLGKFVVGDTKELNFEVTCNIPQLKVICEQEANEKEKEVEKPNSAKFTNSTTKNLRIYFRAKEGRKITLLFKTEKLTCNKTNIDEELQSFEQRIELKYQTKLSNIETIPEDEIKILDEIGNGGEAIVYKAKYKDEIVAIKTYEQGKGIEESEKMAIFRDKYIVEYKKSFYKEINNQKCFCSMLEYAEYGNLEGKNHFISQSILYKIMEDVCKALKYLHEEKKVIHRDIKPKNILIFNYDNICDINAKLTDFGTCETINYEGNIKKGGTENFMAPEMVKGEKYFKHCDIYSLGITMLNSFSDNNFNNCIGNDIQQNGTYIKTTTQLKPDIKKLIIKCCQIDPLKRPDINECLNVIQEIRKTITDNEIFQTINVEQKNVRYSLPKFDLLESIKCVVKSIKELEVSDKYIKTLIMLKFEINADEAILDLQKIDFKVENKGNRDYTTACYYLKKNDSNLINKIYELMINAASKSHPDAIMYLIDILIDIVKGKITIYDEEKNKIYEIINEIYDSDILQNKQHIQYSIQQINNNSISIKNVINIFSILGKYLPICEFQYGIALLHGIGIPENIDDAKLVFNKFKQTDYCKDPQEIEFYQSYCKFIKNNPDAYEEAHDMLDKCLDYSKKLYYYSDALNNKGVILYKGLGCNKDINKAFEYFEKSMNLNNNYGKFNYAYCLCKNKKKYNSELISEDTGMKIMLELANTGFDVAQQNNALDSFINFLSCKKYDLLQESIQLFTQASLQLDYESIGYLGSILGGWSEKQDEDKQNKCNKIVFDLFNIAYRNGYLYAQVSLIDCYKRGKGTEKNLGECKNLCKNILKNIEDDEIVSEKMKIYFCFQYLSVLNEISLQNINIDINMDVIELFETLKNMNNSQINYELGKYYFIGILVEKDINKAIYYLEKSANQGNSNALFTLGQIYYNGNGVKKNINKAIECYKKCAKLNDSNTLNILGGIYYNGDGVDKDIKKAIKYFEKSAKQNNSYALYNLGDIYYTGNGIDKDINKAIECYKKCAKLNDSNALNILGGIHYNGDGVDKDIKKAIKYFEKSADSNNSNALNNLGVIYCNGDGVDKDINKAIDYYKKSAKQNDSNALYNLGLIYLYGNGIDKDINKAIYYFEKVANQNDLNASNKLGVIHYKRNCVDKYINKSINYFEKSANQNNLNSLNFLGQIYLNGDGVDKDINKAIGYFEKAANQNNPDAFFILGDIYYNGNGIDKDINKAIDYFEKAADLNDPKALFNLGVIYYNGNGVDKDINKAIKYYEKSAKQNDSNALYILGGIYLYGNGIDKDINKAIYYFEKAANQNDLDALYNLGLIYYKGNGIDKDINKAIDYFEKSANQNNPDALFNLGAIYFIGNCVDKNINKAIDYFEKSANQNNLNAIYFLGQIYLNGDGVDKDIKKAIYYFEKSADLNNSNALYNLGVIYHNGDGVDKDIDKAIDYYKKSANQNNSHALYNLGDIYYKGNGVDKNINKAIGYFEKAANLNHKKAIQFLKEINLN